MKSHPLEDSGFGQFFPFTEATNTPKDFQGNFLRLKRNKVALNSFLAGELLRHGFGGAILFISVNSGVKCKSTDVIEEEHPHFLAYQRILGGMYGTIALTSLALSLN